MNMAPALVILLSLLAAIPGARALPPAQQPPVTPLTQTAGTVTTGGAFQTVLAANPRRSACSVQNTGAHVGYVWWQTSGSATLAASYQLAAGATWACNLPSGQVIRSAVQYTTGTATDPFNTAESQ